jgi:UTP:GlnB (protein PII) uridylyltransferase
LLEGLYRATKRYLGGVVEPVDASIGQKQTEARSLLQLYALPAQAADALYHIT